MFFFCVVLCPLRSRSRSPSPSLASLSRQNPDKRALRPTYVFIVCEGSVYGLIRD